MYVPVIRNLTNRLFESFDFPEPSETHGAREVTTGPSQALFMMNSAFVRTHATIAAERLMAARQSDEERARHAFRQVLARDPSPGELGRAVERIREIQSGLETEESAASGQSANAWLEEFMAAALDREPAEDEMAAALDYLSSRRRGTSDSAGPAGGLRNDDGSLNPGAAVGMIETALGRRLSREERAAAGKNIRAWRTEQRKRGGQDGAQLMAAVASSEHEAWSRFYHALYNSAEFRYRN